MSTHTLFKVCVDIFSRVRTPFAEHSRGDNSPGVKYLGGETPRLALHRSNFDCCKWKLLYQRTDASHYSQREEARLASIFMMLV